MDGPENPTRPFNANRLTDDKVRKLAELELSSVDLTSHQWDVIGERFNDEPR
jgi:hypothetical protein